MGILSHKFGFVQTMLPSSTTAGQQSDDERVLRLRAELKERWRTSRRARVEELLAQQALADEGLLDLIYQEIVLREEAGEQPVFAEYQERFPNLEAALRRQFALHEMLKSGLRTSPSQVSAASEITSLGSEGSCVRGGFIGHYRLEGELGRGGMGIVFKAHDEKLHRTVALKLLLGKEHASPDQLKRFRMEAESLAKLQHPHIVQIFEIGEHDGAPYFAMEYVAGGTLQIKILESPLGPAEAARLTHLLAEAMHSAHERGIIHRDLKPANVLLIPDPGLLTPIPKITDFGLARQGQSDLTVSGAILGTPSYMAPEQAEGKTSEVGPAADVYALGAILYEMLTGRAPFRGATVALTLHQVMHDDPPPPRRLQPGIPRDLETICLKCLHKNPRQRFASAKALALDLQRFLRGEPILARPIGRLESLAKWARREPKLARRTAAVLLVAMVGFVAVLYEWQAERLERRNKEEQLYFNCIALADRDLEKGKPAWAENALAKCPPALRDWEWQHLAYRCRHGDAPKIDLPGAVSSLATHAAQTSVAVGCNNGFISILDGGQQPRPNPILAHLGSVNWIAFAPDGVEFFSGGEDGRIHGWKLATAEKIKTFAEHQGPISCLAFHPTHPWIASTAFAGPDSGTVFVWDRQTGKRIHTLNNHAARVTGLAFQPGGELLASASHDRTITLWDCRTGQIVRVLRDHRFPIACVTFSPDGSLLASSGGSAGGNERPDRPGENEIFLWDTSAGNVLHRLQGHDQRVVTLAFAPGGTRLGTAGWDNLAKLWDVRTGQEVLALVGHTDGIMALGFSKQGSLFTGSLDRSVRIWRTMER